jgi:dTDP-4-amino-4,6-dideoxy-D-galactose acyltransferase
MGGEAAEAAENVGAGAWRLLPWDTDFFGVRIARVEAASLTDADVAELRAWAEREAVDCIYFLAGAADTPSVRAAERGGFALTDLRVTLERSLPPGELEASESGTDPSIGQAEPGDVDTLASIARGSHRDSRFYADGHFPPERCDDFYEQWIRNSCGDFADVVLVARREGAACGYISGHLEAGRIGRIGLIAVAERARGLSLGPRLVEASLRWFAEAGCERVAVTTQGRNTRAQRLYENAGFRTRSVELWFHLWPGPDAERSGEAAK